jgi:hypothetical protein
MSNIMAVLLNGVAQLEYDRDKPLPDHQELYLDKMDTKMDEGILIGDTQVKNPDINQRAQFVAANLVHAIKNDQEPVAASMCTYLANRLPDLKQVRIDDSNEEVTINLVFDEEYKKQVAVQFTH